jgi:hypothetical protein
MELELDNRWSRNCGWPSVVRHCCRFLWSRRLREVKSDQAQLMICKVQDEGGGMQVRWREWRQVDDKCHRH